MKSMTLAFSAVAALALGTVNAEDGDKPRGDRPSPKEIAERMIENHDEDGDDALNADELKAAHKARKQARKEAGKKRGDGKGRGKGDGKGEGRGERPERPTPEDIVEKFDKDGDGALNTKELSKAIKARHEKMRARRGGGEGRGPRNGGGGGAE